MAHHQKPLVIIGKAGITPNVLKQIDQTLVARELMKVKLPKIYGEERRAMARELAEALNAELIQLMGRIAILYRPNPDEPKIDLPPPRRAQ